MARSVSLRAWVLFPLELACQHSNSSVTNHSPWEHPPGGTSISVPIRLDPLPSDRE
jgi:hypothetical protein